MFKRIHVFVLVCFVANVFSLPSAQAQDLKLPAVGTMLSLSAAYQPALIKGLTINEKNPFLFDFIVDAGQSHLQGEAFKQEADRMIKYFFAGLTVPEKDIWVNLSPYEKDRIIPSALGKTAMGRDLLAQDYILKQLSASLIYPETGLGKKFWENVYAKARQMYGPQAQVPVNTLNKVWIVADKASIYEKGQTAWLVDTHLKVMMEEDYLALEKTKDLKRKRQPGDMFPTEQQNVSPSRLPSNRPLNVKANPGDNVVRTPLAQNIIRDLIIPVLEKEVNEGKNFASLRQAFNSLALAIWFKKNLKEAVFNKVYADKNLVQGIERPGRQEMPVISGAGSTPKAPGLDAQLNAIYEQYLLAYKKGAFNYIKEELNPLTQQPQAKKYFSGGVTVSLAMTTASPTDAARSIEKSLDRLQKVQVLAGSPAMQAVKATPVQMGEEYSVGDFDVTQGPREINLQFMNNSGRVTFRKPQNLRIVEEVNHHFLGSELGEVFFIKYEDNDEADQFLVVHRNHGKVKVVKYSNKPFFNPSLNFIYRENDGKQVYYINSKGNLIPLSGAFLSMQILQDVNIKVAVTQQADKSYKIVVINTSAPWGKEIVTLPWEGYTEPRVVLGPRQKTVIVRGEDNSSKYAYVVTSRRLTGSEDDYPLILRVPENVIRDFSLDPLLLTEDQQSISFLGKRGTSKLIKFPPEVLVEKAVREGKPVDIDGFETILWSDDFVERDRTTRLFFSNQGRVLRSEDKSPANVNKPLDFEVLLPKDVKAIMALVPIKNTKSIALFAVKVRNEEDKERVYIIVVNKRELRHGRYDAVAVLNHKIFNNPDFIKKAVVFGTGGVGLTVQGEPGSNTKFVVLPNAIIAENPFSWDFYPQVMMVDGQHQMALVLLRDRAKEAQVFLRHPGQSNGLLTVNIPREDVELIDPKKGVSITLTQGRLALSFTDLTGQQNNLLYDLPAEVFSHLADKAMTTVTATLVRTTQEDARGRDAFLVTQLQSGDLIIETKGETTTSKVSFQVPQGFIKVETIEQQSKLPGEKGVVWIVRCKTEQGIRDVVVSQQGETVSQQEFSSFVHYFNGLLLADTETTYFINTRGQIMPLDRKMLPTREGGVYVLPGVIVFKETDYNVVVIDRVTGQVRDLTFDNKVSIFPNSRNHTMVFWPNGGEDRFYLVAQQTLPESGDEQRPVIFSFDKGDINGVSETNPLIGSLTESSAVFISGEGAQQKTHRDMPPMSLIQTSLRRDGINATIPTGSLMGVREVNISDSDTLRIFPQGVVRLLLTKAGTKKTVDVNLGRDIGPNDTVLIEGSTNPNAQGVYEFSLSVLKGAGHEAINTIDRYRIVGLDSPDGTIEAMAFANISQGIDESILPPSAPFYSTVGGHAVLFRNQDSPEGFLHIADLTGNSVSLGNFVADPKHQTVLMMPKEEKRIPASVFVPGPKGVKAIIIENDNFTGLDTTKPVDITISGRQLRIEYETEKMKVTKVFEVEGDRAMKTSSGSSIRFPYRETTRYGIQAHVPYSVLSVEEGKKLRLIIGPQGKKQRTIDIPLPEENTSGDVTRFVISPRSHGSKELVIIIGLRNGSSHVVSTENETVHGRSFSGSVGYNNGLIQTNSPVPQGFIGQKGEIFVLPKYLSVQKVDFSINLLLITTTDGKKVSADRKTGLIEDAPGTGSGQNLREPSDAMTASPGRVQEQRKDPTGGIDLADTSSGLRIEKDAQGGVKVSVDKAYIDRILREGIRSMTPMIIHVTPIPLTEIRLRLGLVTPPQPTVLAGR